MSTIHESLRARTSRTPAAIAVACGDHELSYAELDAAADRLAARLLRFERTGPVGVLHRRSAYHVVALLAVLKVGAAYVPIDPRLSPAARAEFLRDAGVRVLVSDGAPSEADVALGLPIVEAGAEEADSGPADVGRVPPDALAYLMRTSGSSGRPKVIGVTHRNVLDLAAEPRFGANGDLRVLLHSAEAFDASVFELWVTLLNGGQVLLWPEPELDIATLSQLVTGRQLTRIWLTAGVFAAVAAEHPQALRGLQEVWTGGDVVPVEAVSRVLVACPGISVVNGYGPTETTVFATSHAVGDPVGLTSDVPIGRPLLGVRAYVLDDSLRPVPQGQIGELYIGGAGIARGYAGQPAMTAERFVADPFTGEGSRMYRSGDLVRAGADAALHFAGRADDQVKIRGFRVEPGEVEAALLRFPDVARAAVTVRENGTGQRALAAYVVPAEGCAPEPAELRARLGAQLPDYLVPETVLPMSSFPVTANGKLDRRALPDPPVPGRAGGSGKTPGTRREELFAGLVVSVLGIAEAPVDQGFFELGGDSISALRLVARAAGAGWGITLRDVFAWNTIAELAQAARPVQPLETTAVPGLEPARLDDDELAMVQSELGSDA
ncbi:non-ribosomal peptide synthetase [Amycolatopsis sp. DG1A-15b]|uniref:non-ribosomal peptide synthetase n=1 Tax=Amycolatopsis sp. DG1A-15b TaxID=3052846 RepID=UPI00255BBCBD|nr:non-ribosomal peptide synthetase [Amycolatopsis sp. DG1A-15b]WIX92951.1 non-ribosomal peptide synthetase [Amycolatopsis sp. DG1A-15b]